MKSTTKKTKSSGKSQMPGAITESGNELGLIRIHENVISSIVRKAACSVEGVVRLAGNTIVDNIAEIVGSKKIHDRSIAITFEEAKVNIEIKINIRYGVHVPSVASEVQTAVTEQVEALTGMTVSQVNVIIQELDDYVEDDEEAAEVES